MGLNRLETLRYYFFGNERAFLFLDYSGLSAQGLFYLRQSIKNYKNDTQIQKANLKLNLFVLKDKELKCLDRELNFSVCFKTNMQGFQGESFLVVDCRNLELVQIFSFLDFLNESLFVTLGKVHPLFLLFELEGTFFHIEYKKLRTMRDLLISNREAQINILKTSFAYSFLNLYLLYKIVFEIISTFNMINNLCLIILKNVKN